MQTPLQDEFRFYLANQDEFVTKHHGKYIVLKDGEVLGVYDSDLEAVRATEKEHPLGTFLVQRCEPGTESYTRVCHSRVI